MSPVRTRIAPSPTGFPHVGTVFQALFDYVIARQHRGSFVMRLEDTDQARFVDGAEEALCQAFEWAGLTPDEGPKYGGNYGPYRQSERLELYKKHAEALIESGHAYYCFCSPERLEQVRSEMQAKGLPPMYDRHCRTMDPAKAKAEALQTPHVIRMKVPDHTSIEVKDMVRGSIIFDSDTVDDQVLLKSDGFPTYHLAVVVDDHYMEISHLVRGEEWISSAPKHVLLYQYFDWPMPLMLHTPLLRNPNKSKLGKRHGHASITWYQEKGYLPEALLNFLMSRVWNHPEGKEVYPLSEAIQFFRVEDMHIQGPIVDLSKLDWYNGLYIRSLSDEELVRRLTPYVDPALNSKLRAIVPLIKERLVTLGEAKDLTSFFIGQIQPDPGLLVKRSDAASVLDQLQHTIELCEAVTEFSPSTLEEAFRTLATANDYKPSQYFMMIRIAVTGQAATPPLFDTMAVIGKELCLDRLRGSQKLLSSTT